jgi:hypothetical protein
VKRLLAGLAFHQVMFLDRTLLLLSDRYLQLYQ